MFIKLGSNLIDNRKSITLRNIAVTSLILNFLVPFFVGDRYDEEPRRRGGLDDFDEFDTGRKSIADEAVDKVKGLWNKVQGRHGPEDIVDYRYYQCLKRNVEIHIKLQCVFSHLFSFLFVVITGSFLFIN